jgi:MFS-type transporter involved in bile tolerance (Atg22 family)
MMATITTALLVVGLILVVLARYADGQALRRWAFDLLAAAVIVIDLALLVPRIL